MISQSIPLRASQKAAQDRSTSSAVDHCHRALACRMRQDVTSAGGAAKGDDGVWVPGQTALSGRGCRASRNGRSSGLFHETRATTQCNR
jgi:hypothetical protein